KRASSALNRTAQADTRPRASASTSAQGSNAAGALDGDRFSIRAEKLWKGHPDASSWWWQVEFSEPREIGAILQVNGDRELALRNSARRYVWQVSEDGMTWQDLKETATVDERRAFRVHRLKQSRRTRSLRLAISSAEGEAPAIREVEIFGDSD